MSLVLGGSYVPVEMVFKHWEKIQEKKVVAVLYRKNRQWLEE